jgi:hypothetical protein
MLHPCDTLFENNTVMPAQAGIQRLIQHELTKTLE